MGLENESAPARGAAWKWTVCGLLLLATMINYMDRLTLNLLAPEIQAEMHLNDEQYGQIEWVFGVGFAVGALLMGWSADRWNVWWLYPMAVLTWSAAGFVTGFAQTLLTLMMCRLWLGVCEAGNWPCALRTTQRILRPDERTMGNSILQSGAAIGAIVTPFIVLALVGGEGTWRYPFFVVGAVGTFWVAIWLMIVRRADLALPDSTATAQTSAPAEPLLPIYLQRRFFVLVVLVITINLTWHFFRAWLPKFLRVTHEYDATAVNYFTSAYYLATDIGSLTAGFATLYIARRWAVPVHWSRVVVFVSAASLTTLSVVVSQLDKGPLLLGLLLVIGFGALALFPVYYSLSQELTVRHQGKITGTLGFCTWMASATMHPIVGKWLDSTREATGQPDYKTAVAIAGLFPLLGVVALLFFWGKDRPGGNS